ncbi:MAG: class I SAM-dependent methyltransferase [Anaerolineae bacterium]|nr:class I SAM-dependent methyltransferase [Anaerolineae bacterium]
MDDRELIARWQREEQQPFQGWDFGYLRGHYHEEQPPWSYEYSARDLLRDVDSVLDMGTGGGEKLLEFADVLPPRTVATEGYAPNVAVARANLAPHHIDVVEYDAEADDRMPFDDGVFPLILNRHEAYDASEVTRILRPGGRFLTQQVDGRDLSELLAAFGLTSGYLHVNLADCRRELEQAGLSIDQALDWQGRATFSDVGALVYFLHAAPWTAPPDFSVERCADVLLKLHHQRQPLAFDSRRFLILAHRRVK